MLHIRNCCTALFISVLFGCVRTVAVPFSEAPSTVTIRDIEVLNASSTELRRVVVRLEEDVLRFGYVGPGKRNGHVSVYRQMPSSVGVECSVSNDVRVAQFENIIPNTALADVEDLVLRVTYTSQKNVSLEFLHFIQSGGRAQLVPIEGASVGPQHMAIEPRR